MWLKNGLIFKSAHSLRDHGLIMQSVDRSLLPEVKRQQVDIMSIPGKFDLQDEPIYDNRVVSVKFTYHAKSLSDLQAKKRETAQWLSGRSKLIFDDEPEKYYDAKVFSAIAIEQTFKTLSVQIEFECAPYAYGDLVILPIAMGQNKIDYKGNAKTPTLITIRNMSGNTVNNIFITAVVRKTGKGTTS
jgi:predicted phage tail component-like protein